MKIREKINISLSVLIGLLGVTGCHHVKTAAKQKPQKDTLPEERVGQDTEIMLMYGVPAPGDITLDSVPELQPQQPQQPQPQRPQIMVKYGVPPQLRNK